MLNGFGELLAKKKKKNEKMILYFLGIKKGPG